MSVFLQPLQTVTVGATSVATITFSSIPQTYTDLVVKLSARSDASDGTFWKTVSINFNSDSSALYSYTWLLGQGATTFTTNSSNSTYGVSWIAGNLNTANTFSNTEYYIPNYASSNFKSFIVDSTAENNGAVALNMLTANLYRSTNAISSITLNASNFVQYTKVSLYGVLRQGI